MNRFFVLAFLFSTMGVRGDPFVNLGFAEVNTNTSQLRYIDILGVYGRGPATDLMPGWQIVQDGVQLTNINFNAGTGIYYQAGLGYWWGGIPPSALIDKAVFVFDFQDFSNTITLTQRGDIPSGTMGLRLDILDVNSAVFLAINRMPVPIRFISAFAALSADISAFAGENVELELTISRGEPPLPGGGSSYAVLDGVQFIVPDVVFEHQDGSIGVWFMNRGPDLISASFFNPQAVADPRWHIVGTGNFNTDNRSDLLFQHEDGTLAVWYMAGTNLLSAVLLNPSQPGEGWKVVGTGDMNHDGGTDILFQHTDGTLAVWFMGGINVGQGALLNPNKPGGSGWRVVGTAELTRAGNTDLIFQHSDGTLAAWYMDGINLVRGTLLNPATPGEAGWRVATTLDLNGDGKTDLLFQHDDGTVAVWLMDGINLISGQLLNPSNPGSGWRIVGPR